MATNQAAASILEVAERYTHLREGHENICLERVTARDVIRNGVRSAYNLAYTLALRNGERSVSLFGRAEPTIDEHRAHGAAMAFVDELFGPETIDEVTPMLRVGQLKP